MSPPIPESINLVDFSHVLTVNFKARAKNGDVNEAGQATVDQIRACREQASHTIICLDSGPYWRKTVYPDYKKGREREPEYGSIYSWTLERLEKDGFNIARAPGEEADDVVATLARIYVDEFGCRDVRIVTQDKDVGQCLNDNVRMFVPILGKRNEFEIRDADWLKKKYEGIGPKDFSLLLAIMGDDSDHIPGLKGIGVKHGARLIEVYKDPEGMAKGLVNASNDAKLHDKKLAAVWVNFAAGMVDLPKWWKLTTLNTEAALELHPLKYLEKLPQQSIVGDAFEGELAEEYDPEDGEQRPEQEIAWDAVAVETEAKQIREMAAALPVGTTKSSPPPVGQPLIGKDPQADEHLRRAFNERGLHPEPSQSGPQPMTAPSATTAAASAPIPSAAASPSSAPASQSQAQPAKGSADPKASAPTAAPSLAAEPKYPVASVGSASGAGTAEVVPRSQGPQPERLAMAVVPPPSWELATQPRSPSEMAIVAARFYNSRFYSAHGNPDGTFAVIALGRELGLGAAASVESFYIVQGRPFAKATTLKALAEKDPNCEWIMITSADDKHATIETRHRALGKVLSYTYTIERAAAAGYLTGNNKENWKTKTQEMLEARATSKGVRRWYPGAIMGMHSFEEAKDD